MKGLRGFPKFYRAYQHALVKHPVKVQSVQTAILAGMGDIIAQTIIEKKQLGEFDVKRFLAFAGYGGIFIGPSLRVWFGILDTKLKGSAHAVLLQKVLLDQLIMAPISLFLCVSVVNALGGKSIPQIKEKIKADYVNILITNYKVWPAVQLINFSLVPVSYQVPVSQIVGVFWNSYLSWKANENPEVAKED